MADTPVRDFADRCRDDLPGIGSPLLNRLVADAARELCRAGRLWRITFDPITVTTAETRYELVGHPDYALIHDIAEVRLNSVPVYTVTPDATVQHRTQARYKREGDCIVMESEPAGESTATGTLTVSGVLIPKPGAACVPDILWNEWVETMEHGIKAMAMLKPQKDYTNEGMGIYHQGQWKNGLAKARTYGRAGNMTARRRSHDPWGRNYGRNSLSR